MDKQDQQRVNAAFEHGSKDFSQEDLNKVMADEKTAMEKAKFLGDQFENFKILWSLLKDFCARRYTDIPWKSIAAIGFAVAYLISPIDIIPDFIPIAGFIDDASVFALVVKALEADIEAYKKWRIEELKSKSAADANKTPAN